MSIKNLKKNKHNNYHKLKIFKLIIFNPIIDKT